jgi:hypothetical protein
MAHLDVPEVLIVMGVACWLGLAMYNWRHPTMHPACGTGE